MWMIATLKQVYNTRMSDTENILYNVTQRMSDDDESISCSDA